MMNPTRILARDSSRKPCSRLVLLGLLGLVACNSSNNDSTPPPIGVTPDPVVTSSSALPGVAVQITAVRGGSGPGGAALVGDRLTVDFTLQRDDGVALELSGLTRGSIMVSGPTFNYQRVIASQDDVRTRAVKTAVDRYSYTFETPIPATYLAPLNKFDPSAPSPGELTGQALLSGTYTVGIELRKDYTVEGETFRDPGNATADFLFGDAVALTPREVVLTANCNQCHTTLRAHGDNRTDVVNCLLCHTAGAEDRNVATAANGTPGALIDFKVMIHKIHSGAHLPSVLGVTTNPDGSRNYNATPQPYELVGFGNSVIDFSDVAWPAWPSFFTPMPRDGGYAALNTPATSEGARRQGLENTMRGAPVQCDKCHGDPDAAGPLAAPAQADLIWSQPSRAACGSCHDDWVPDHPYTANTMTMPPQPDDSACKQCHRPSGTSLDVQDAHRHPLVDAAIARGLHIAITSVTDVPAAGNGNGKFDPGEKVRVTFQALDDTGTPVAVSTMSSLQLALNGPTTNPNIVHLARVAQNFFVGTGPFTFDVPAPVYYEPIGTSAVGLQVFPTSRAPHWNVTNAATTLLRRTGVGASTVLAAGAEALQNYLDVTPGTGATIAPVTTGSATQQPYIVIEDAVAGRREYMRVQWREGDRLWFSSQYNPTFAPRINVAHAIGSSVQVVTTATVATGNYSLDALAGIVTETTEFGDGEILASYTAPFVVPAAYPGSFNDTPDIDESWGDWSKLPILSGTYSMGLYGARSVPVVRFGETTSYSEGSTPAIVNLLFGTATVAEPVARIDSVQNCYSCHADIQFHGGSRRGVETCLLCHGVAGAEDAARFTYPNAVASPSTVIEFRDMLHKIHAGSELAAGAGYVVVGNSGTGHSYDMVHFPSTPGGVKNCVACHGADNTAWQQPVARNHPNQLVPTRAWRVACGSCHDSSAAAAHIDVNTSPSGAEACAICHGAGEEKNVPTVHLIR